MPGTQQVFQDKIVKIDLDTSKIDKMLGGVLEVKANRILDKAAFSIEAIAKTLAAVDTGAMRASVYVSGASGGSNYAKRKAEAMSKAASHGETREFHKEVSPTKRLERIIGASVIYAIFPEVMGQPYIVPAVEQERPKVNAAWKQLFEFL